MQTNIKKMLLLLASSIGVATNTTHANSDSAQLRNLENRVNALEQRRGASGMVNPPGRPQVRDGVDLFLFGDLLVWNAHENGLPIGVVNKGSATNISNSKIRSIHSDWDLGFRLGLGYNMPHDAWDLSLTWLRFYTNGSKHIHAHTGRFIFPSRVHPTDELAGSAAAATANSHWKNHLNQLDLDLGREFFVSKWLTLRPHFGVRTDWISQKWKNTYRNFNSAATPNKVVAEYKDKWWGLGLEAGLDTQWGLGAGFSLFGNLTGSILYGFHDLNYMDTDTPAQANTTAEGTFANTRTSYRVSHPTLDLVLGLRYDHMFFDDRFHWGVEIGWEQHVYFSQNQFPVFVDNLNPGNFVSNQGDLTYQGWTIGMRFDF